MTAKDALPEAGFTLIEAMVALAILGIAAVGIVRAVEAHVDTTAALEQRAAAQWVAQNALAELSLPVARDIILQDVEMLGSRWSVRTDMSASEDPDVRMATVRVSPSGSDAPLITLTGFVDAGTITQ